MRARTLIAVGAVLVAAGASAGAAEGKRRAPVVSKVTGVPKQVAAGQRFKVTVTLRARGRTRPRGVVRLFLSRDRRKGRGDVALKRRIRVKPRRAGRAARRTRATVAAKGKGSGRVAVPAGTPPGAYHVLACARRSCRAAPMQVRGAFGLPGLPPLAPSAFLAPLVPGPAPAPAPAAPAPEATPAPTASPTPTPTASPTVTPTPTATPTPPVNTPPALATDGATSMYDATAWLFSGANPPQQGVAAGAIDPERVAVLRGQVADRDARPLSGVAVSVLDRPAWGATTTREDGGFDLAVNGGGRIVLQFEKEGYLRVQRTLERTPWQDYQTVEVVALTPLDAQTTTIDPGSNADFQVARGSPQADDDGARRATLLFPRGAQAEMTLPDGSEQALEELTVRATEYTAGLAGGPAMPGTLPPTSGYTYAVDFTVDEALAADAEQVRFAKPLVNYTENLIGAPVGTPVPTGYYDPQRAVWVPAPNGLVIRVAGEANGLAEVDVDSEAGGDAAGESAAELAARAITEAERRQLASLYGAGQELWRVEITHFTPWDHNWPWGPPECDLAEGCAPPLDDLDPTPEDQCEVAGSIIGCENQSLGEEVAITGSRAGLRYQSDRVPGWRPGHSFEVPVTGPAVPAGLQAIVLEVDIAGQHLEQQWCDPGFERTGPEVCEDLPEVAPNLRKRMTWDGRDAYGRLVRGRPRATIRLAYIFEPSYYPAGDDFRASFAQFPSGTAFGRPRCEVRALPFAPPLATGGGTPQMAPPQFKGLLCGIRVERSITRSLGSWSAVGSDALGGWTLDVHHAYDPHERALRLGDGRTVRAQAREFTGRTYAGSARAGKPLDEAEGGPATEAAMEYLGEIELAGDGSLYFADGFDSQIYRVGTNGRVHHFAGSGETPPGHPVDGDGGPAEEAALHGITDLAAGPDGSLYLGEEASNGAGYVRRIGPDGTISTLAGTGLTNPGPDGIGDGGPAREADVSGLRDVTLGPDGGVYFSELPTITNGFKGRVRRIDGLGDVDTVAGGGGDATVDEPAGSGKPATEYDLPGALGIAFGPDGAMYLAHPEGHMVTRVGVDGRLERFAGNGQAGESADGGLARTSALANPVNVAVSRNGDVWLRTRSGGDDRLRRITPDGFVRVIAGGRSGCTYTADQYEAGVEAGALCPLGTHARGLEVAPDGGVFYTDGRRWVGRLGPPLPGFAQGSQLIPSPDGGELYEFDGDGRHQRTLDALTGIATWRFAYDGAGRLASATDRDDNVVRIERDGAGRPVAIVAPRGQRTQLELSDGGYLERITDPAGGAHRFAYGPGGLLESHTAPGDGVSSFDYDGQGRLVRDENASGHVKTLTRTETDTRVEVALRTSLGRTTTYTSAIGRDGVRTRTVREPSGGESKLVIRPDGTRTLTAPDGHEVTTVWSPDPRFGAAAPITSRETVRTPAGRSRVTEVVLKTELPDPANPFLPRRMSATATVNGDRSTSTWNRETRSLTTRSAEGRTGELKLDAGGHVTSVQPDAALAPATYTYDGHGRTTRIEQGPRSTTFAYGEGSDLPASAGDGTGRTETYGYDAAERLTAIGLPGGGTQRLEYDADGFLGAVEMPNGAEHRFTRTPEGSEASYTPPGNAAFETEYDADGAASAYRLPERGAIAATYDDGGRKTRTRQSDATVDIGYLGGTSLRASWLRTPDGAGPAAGLAIGRDGPLVDEIATTGAAPGSFDLAYDDDLLPSSRAFTSGADSVSTAFAHDRDGLTTTAGPLALTRGGPAGAASRIADGAAMRADVAHDAIGRVSGWTQDVGGARRYGLELSHDAAGRVTQRVETVGGAAARTYAYDYDARGRLVEVERDGSVVEAYVYDANGNRTSARYGTAAAQAASYDAQDRLTARAGTAHGFDADGFLTGRGADDFEYGAGGELLSATVGGQSVSYAYDGIGRRVSRTAGGGTERYFYGNPEDPWQLTASRSAGGALTVYHHDDAGVIAFDRGGSRYYVAHDQLGSPRLVSDAAGAPVKAIEYDAFGRVLSDSAPAFDLPVGFAGGLADADTGLVRFGLRDYDPAAGRWTARDPIGFDGGQANLYAYVGSDPVSARDPSGLACHYKLTFPDGSVAFGSIVKTVAASDGALSVDGGQDYFELDDGSILLPENCPSDLKITKATAADCGLDAVGGEIGRNWNWFKKFVAGGDKKFDPKYTKTKLYAGSPRG